MIILAIIAGTLALAAYLYHRWLWHGWPRPTRNERLDIGHVNKNRRKS